MTVDFLSSGDFSVGMEMEFQMVDERTWDLVEGVLPLLELYPQSEYVKPEFIQNTVEVASRPCTGVAELGAHVTRLITELDRKCRRLGFRLCGAGTHPFNQDMASITPFPRYLTIGEAAGYLGHSQITFATHVHVGVDSGDEAIALMSGLKPYLPLLIAVSANSPFWRGEDTRFAAFRHRILAASRNYGLPPDFGNWRDFEEFYDAMTRAGVIGSVNDIHWDIRPRPHLGTLEIRVMDAQRRATDALAIAAFVRALVMFLREQPDAATRGGNRLSPLPWWTTKDNCYNASRFGLEARLIVNQTGEVAPVTDLVEDTLVAIEPYAKHHGEDGYLDTLRETLQNGGPYDEQRRLLQETGSLAAIVETFAEQLIEDSANDPVEPPVESGPSGDPAFSFSSPM